MKITGETSNISAFAVYQKKVQKKNKVKKVKRLNNKCVPTPVKKVNPVPKANVRSASSTANGIAKSKKLNVNNKRNVKEKKQSKQQSEKPSSTKKIKLTEEVIPQLVQPQTNSCTKPIDKAIRKEHEHLNDDSSNSLDDAQTLLAWMLAPKKPANFFENHWEAQPLHVPRTSSTYYKHLLSSTKLDEMLRENPLYFTRNVDVVSYENGKRETHNPEGRAVPSAVWDYYQNGCSVRILNPQTYNSKIHLLLATLQEYFGTMVGANVYLTPPGSQGFAPHYDDIEAFVLQLEGRKHWKLYAPRNKNEFLARDSSHNLSRDELGELLEEVTLEAGSLLYFPRGIVHEACTDTDSHSLHLTVSVYQHTSYADLLEKLLPSAIKSAVSKDIDFRRGLPLQYLKYAGEVNKDVNSDIKSVFKKTVEKLVKKLVDYVDVDGAVDQLGRKFMRDALPPVFSTEEKLCTVKKDGEYLLDGKVMNRVEFTPDTEVRLLRYYSIRLVKEEGQLRLYYSTENSRTYHDEEEQYLDIDDSMMSAIKQLSLNFPKYTAVEDLPIVDDAVKFQVVSDLWERGILRTRTPLMCIDEED